MQKDTKNVRTSNNTPSKKTKKQKRARRFYVAVFSQDESSIIKVQRCYSSEAQTRILEEYKGLGYRAEMGYIQPMPDKKLIWRKKGDKTYRLVGHVPYEINRSVIQ